MTPLDYLLAGDSGISSQTILHVMEGTARPRRVSIPWDPADFGRCHRMLELFPEWRPRLPEVAAAYPSWTRLVERWDDVTALYLKELGRPDRRAPETFALMKSLRPAS